MNELQRQAYLSALGVENYMPRWQLPFAPSAYSCELSGLSPEVLSASTSHIETKAFNEQDLNNEVTIAPKRENETVRVLENLNTKLTQPTKITISSLLQQLDQPKEEKLQSFSLSIWRPLPGFLIIDSRRTALALPTELLLHNVLLSLLGKKANLLEEEVLSWPMVENRFVSRTRHDARTELQTWLAVENELRPINKLWLMGSNAIQHFLSLDDDSSTYWWMSVTLPESNMVALALPGLTELLQQPQLKSLLWSCIQQ